MATFFISYARANDGSNLRKFFSDLVRMLQERADQDQGQDQKDLVFIDREMPPGVDWTQEIGEALRTCQIFLSVESPAYFRSEYCGKEWSVFRKRLDEHPQTTQGAVPPLHIRVPWLPISDRQLKRIPQTVRRIQDIQEALGHYARTGLESLVRGYQEVEYQDALTKLVDLVIDAWDKHFLPYASDSPDFGMTESAFRSSDQIEAEGGRVTADVGHVLFGIVAGSRDEIHKFRDLADSYGNEPIHWKPFYPAVTQGIGTIAQGVAFRLNLASGYLQVDGNLTIQLREAERVRNIVVLLVDPWALEIDRYGEYFQSYDAMHHINCSLLIPWPGDSQTRKLKAKLSDRIRSALFKTALREPRSYREDIDSRERFESKLIEAIILATALIIERLEVTRRVESAIAMPRLPGPGGI